MNIVSLIRIPKDGIYSLQDCWNFTDQELSPLANGIIEQLSSDSFRRKTEQLIHLCRSVVEFQDLVSLPLPHSGRHIHTGYLFFEGLSALRQALLCGLTGSFEASFSILRTALERFVFHEWWRRRLFGADSHEDFYRWLEGQSPSHANFKGTLKENFKALNAPRDMLSFEQVYQEVYQFLCRYTHRPLFDQSLTKQFGGTPLSISDAVLTFWIEALNKALVAIVQMMISARPESLFPYDLVRKFSFNWPMGIFFSAANLEPIEQAFGADLILQWRHHFSGEQIVSDLRHFIEQRPDLTDAEILAEWDEDELWDDELSIVERIRTRTLLITAKSRALRQGFAYSRMEFAEATKLQEIKWLFEK